MLIRNIYSSSFGLFRTSQGQRHAQCLGARAERHVCNSGKAPPSLTGSCRVSRSASRSGPHGTRRSICGTSHPNLMRLPLPQLTTSLRHWGSAGLARGAAFDCNGPSNTLHTVSSARFRTWTKRRARALVPGCGRGYDCIALARHGFSEVVGLKLSQSATATATAFVKVCAHCSAPIMAHGGRCMAHRAPPTAHRARHTAHGIVHRIRHRTRHTALHVTPYMAHGTAHSSTAQAHGTQVRAAHSNRTSNRMLDGLSAR